LVSSMLQCVESKHDQTTKDKGGGGGTTTITTYTYSVQWKDKYVDSSRFHDRYPRECDRAQNPRWPAAVPRSSTNYVDTMKVGAFTGDKDLAKKVSLNTPVTAGRDMPGWREMSGEYTTDQFQVGSSRGIGKVKVNVYSNDWSNPRVTVLGENNAGTIGPWTAPSSWLCSGFTLHDLRMGSQSKDQLFGILKSENVFMTWMFRIVGFLVLWCAFSLMFGPLGVATDCIPCIGPMLGDSIECIACCISCLPATICFLGVWGVVWTIMRPMIGVPLMLLWVCMAVWFCVYAAKKQGQKAEPGVMSGVATGTPNYGAAFPVAAQAAQPVAAQQSTRQMQVTCPAGSGPGSLVQVVTPEGVTVQTAIPQGVAQGGVFMINY